MRAALASVTAAVALLASGSAYASERRPRVEQDECSRRTQQCEKGCDAKKGTDRLSCKTDCRFAETQCRNGKK
ncbi:MAG: hypothetical protein QM765_38585 [Myxococcales bacterium]